MQRNAYSLAAFAVAAVPGVVPSLTTVLTPTTEGLHSAGLITDEGRKLVVTVPQTAAAGAVMEKDVHVAEALLGTSLRALICPVVGSAPIPEGGRAVVTPAAPGSPIEIDAISASHELAASLGSAIAHIHAVPRYVAEATAVESFTAEELRDTHRQRFTRAREAALLPTAVAQRWEHVLADDDLWNFDPCFVHGDLSPSSVFAHEGTVTGLLAWGSAHIGDPAQDLAWLFAGLDSDSFDALYAGYRRELPTVPHRRLMERAQVMGEFAVLQWLLHGVDTEDDVVREDAEQMLADLDADLAESARTEAEQAYEDLTHGEH